MHRENTKLPARKTEYPVRMLFCRRIYLRLAALGLVSSALLPAQLTNPVELWKHPTPPPNERLSYGDDPLQFGELRLPEGTGPFPVAILIHGGCWEVKLKTLPEGVTSFELLRPMAAALAKAGIATWNVEYRRLGNAGGGWPGTYLDLGKAADHLRELSSRFHLDLRRVIVVGHSSGGQLAVWLAARGRLLKTSPIFVRSPLPVVGVVDVDGPPDLNADRAIEQRVCGAPVITQFMGGTPTEFPDRYREGSVSGLIPIGVRQEVFASQLFNEPWFSLFKQYVEDDKKAGDDVHLTTMTGAGHFDGINPQSPTWQPVLESIQTLLKRP